MWAASFPHHTDDVGYCLNLEGPGDEMQDTRHSTQVKVTTQADETEGAEIIETYKAPMEDVPLLVAPVDKLTIEMALVEIAAFKVPPVAVIEHVIVA